MGKNASDVTELAIIHFDGGGLSPGPVAAACTLDLSDGSSYEDVKRFDQGTHNVAEYQALMLGLRLALKHGARDVEVRGDSKLVVNQVNGEWKTKHPGLLPLRAEAEELLREFKSSHIKWIPREENGRADALATKALNEKLPPIFESDRTFQIWRASVGHSQLLLRSTKSETEATRIDILFKPVAALKLRTRLSGLSVRGLENPEASAVLDEAGDDLDGEAKVFVVESDGFTGWVVASGMWHAEDEDEYSDPSPLFVE